MCQTQLHVVSGDIIYSRMFLTFRTYKLEPCDLFERKYLKSRYTLFKEIEEIDGAK